MMILIQLDCCCEFKVMDYSNATVCSLPQLTLLNYIYGKSSLDESLNIPFVFHLPPSLYFVRASLFAFFLLEELFLEYYLS